jgi:hypothetical protein
MGMYTEIYINVDLKKDTPDDVIGVLKALCRILPDQECDEVIADYPSRWIHLFSNMSYYTPNTYCHSLTFDAISNQWSLLGKGDIKNYGNEIEEFFEWIMPWIEGSVGDFIGYQRYEEDQLPTLHTLKEVIQTPVEEPSSNPLIQKYEELYGKLGAT